jgi:hypothetical protein
MVFNSKKRNRYLRIDSSPGSSPTDIEYITETPSDEIQKKMESTVERNLKVFGIDITNCSSTIQLITLMTGLLLFMCLYGYFQELVIYGWFNRKLSMFSTFMHFLGCSIFAQVQRRYLNSFINTNSKLFLNNNSKMFSVSMGNASTRVAIGYYLLQIILKTLTQGLANLSMSQINYPAKVLFKSANPVITLIIGLVWFRKSYPLRDYLVVILLILGLYIFIAFDKTSSPQGTGLGILYVSLSMLCGASIPMIQEHCMSKYGATVEELLYYSFLGSAVVSFIIAVIAGEMIEGILFFFQQGSVHLWIIFACFTSVGFYGANFSTLLTQRFGALVNGIANTLRKGITLALSFALFPERNVLTVHHIVGAVVFMTGLLLRIAFKEKNTILNVWGAHISTKLHSATSSITQIIPPQKTHLEYDDNRELVPILSSNNVEGGVASYEDLVTFSNDSESLRRIHAV